MLRRAIPPTRRIAASSSLFRLPATLVNNNNNNITSISRRLCATTTTTNTTTSSASTAQATKSDASAAAINPTGTSDDLTGFHGEEEAPVLHFLATETGLLEATEGTLAKCDELLALLDKTSDPVEKHDILDTTSNVLCLLLDPCEFVRQVHPDNHYKYYANEAFLRGHEYMCRVNGRRELYDVLMELSTPEAQKALGDEAKKNVAQLRKDMENNGIHLPDAKRKRIEELNIEKEELAMQFLRDQDTKDPFGVLRHLLACRYTLAQELGYESYAEQQLVNSTLNSQQKVWHFLCGMAHKYRPECEKEVALLYKNLGEVRSRDNITDVDRCKVATSIRNDMEPKELTQYFTVANCVRGIQVLCKEVFGIQLVQRPFAPEENFLPHAMKFHAFDHKKNFLGVIIVDMFARSSKHCQAAHLTVQLGCRPHVKVLKKVGLELGDRQYPVVVLTCNAGSRVKATLKADGTLDAEGTCMLPYEVNTCFHEFGHALHTLLGQTQVQNLAGTRGPVDFVETFSQLFEQFLTDHEFVSLWAERMGTGQKIPESLIERRNAAANIFEHLDTLDQIQLSAVDQCLHGPQPFTVYFPHGDEGVLGKRTLGTLNEYGKGMYNFARLVVDISTPMAVATPTDNGVLRTLSFEHLSSYPGAYYGYLYSLAIAKRIFTKKFGSKPLNSAAGKELAEQVMSLGAACKPAEVLEKYLGDDLDEIDVWA